MAFLFATFLTSICALPIQLHYIYIPFQTTYLNFISLIFFLVFVKFFYTHQQGRNKKVILFFGHSFLNKWNFIARNVIPQRFFLNLVIRQDLFHLLVIKFYWLKVISALFITIQYQKFLLYLEYNKVNMTYLCQHYYFIIKIWMEYFVFRS